MSQIFSSDQYPFRLVYSTVAFGAVTLNPIYKSLDWEPLLALLLVINITRQFCDMSMKNNDTVYGRDILFLADMDNYRHLDLFCAVIL